MREFLITLLGIVIGGYWFPFLLKIKLDQYEFLCGLTNKAFLLKNEIKELENMKDEHVKRRYRELRADFIKQGFLWSPYIDDPKYKDLAKNIIDEFDNHIKKATTKIDDMKDFDRDFESLGYSEKIEELYENLSQEIKNYKNGLIKILLLILR
ncbi:hypothetical protein [Prochlorococcus sp. MIT 0604]|uniref:hypothetical protein n=1 Tax=Prochlorococcus sp. MIT 0604 TaxID=1501268 RepID=UPI0004F6D186|nr:hypothetical protein [Prochlorococcus sp. MIT 0604]AIQ96007.1 hypothetical protein EW14_2000 [Prochlorococcus sp. MIT 0604]